MVRFSFKLLEIIVINFLIYNSIVIRLVKFFRNNKIIDFCFILDNRFKLYFF